jgi:uncharacterized membrane protein YoaK (UPF0700 family)
MPAESLRETGTGTGRRSGRPSRVERSREKAWLAVVLASVAGFVDTVGYLTLYQLFTAHMSGNSARLGVELGGGELSAAVRYSVIIPLFVVGVAGGVALVEIAQRRSVRAPVAAALAVETLLLVVFMLAGSAMLERGPVPQSPAVSYNLLISLPVLAMGLQTAALRRVRGRTVRTTYVTGMLTQLAENGMHYLFYRRREARDWLLLTARVWGLYLGGGVFGAFLEHRLRLWSLSVPVSALVVLATIDLLWPVQLLVWRPTALAGRPLDRDESPPARRAGDHDEAGTGDGPQDHR